MKNSLICEPLGLFGWKELEPVILAALSSKDPLLLIGKHGSAKSFILEKLAKALNRVYRFYNASLINYDDLVGIPVPNADYTSLHYIANDTSIWDAEVVFFDEINRTKPELQNKLFPIIHERRIQGQNLDKLVYRWAAMNPAYLPDDEDDMDLEYVGVSKLDEALADRFYYVVSVPTWDELDDSDKEKILDETFVGSKSIGFNLESLIQKVQEEVEDVKRTYLPLFKNYILNLIPLLKQKIGYVSTRRVNILLKNLVYLHAASLVLCQESHEDKEDLLESLYIHILCSIPNIANTKILSLDLIGIAKAAYSNLSSSLPERKILQFQDPAERILYCLENREQLPLRALQDNITSNLGDIDKAERRMLAFLSYNKLRDLKNLDAAFIETLSKESRRVMANHTNMIFTADLKQYDAYLLLVKLIAKAKEDLKGKCYDEKFFHSLHNLFVSLFEDGLIKDNNALTTAFNRYLSFCKEVNEHD